MSTDPAKPISEPAMKLVSGSYETLKKVTHSLSNAAGQVTGQKPSPSTPSADSPSDGLMHLASELAQALVKFTTEIASTVAKEAVNVADTMGASVTKNDTVGSVAAPFVEAVRHAAGIVVTDESSVLELPAASPGQVSATDVVIRNDSAKTFDGARLQCHALIGPGGAVIDAGSIKFQPATVDVQPKATVSVRMTVTLGASVTRGRYVGLVEAADLPGVQLMTTIDVI